MIDEAGNIWEVDGAGNPVSFVGTQGAQQGGMTIGTPNTAKVRGDELKNQLTQVQINKMISDMNKPDKENEPKLPVGYRMKADGSGAELIPGVAAPGANAGGKTDKAGAYRSVVDQINRTYELYNQSIGQTNGAAGIMDYLPTEANSMFDTAGAALGDQGNAAFKVPGMGAQSDADAARFVAANQPQASDRDGAALEKLRALRQRLEANMDAVGLPAPQFSYGLDGQPIAEQRDDDPMAAAMGGQPPQGRGPNMPQMVGGLPQGSDIEFGFAKQDGGFDRNAWLQSNYGITPDQEASVTAFMKANRGNPNFNYDDLAGYYKAIGLNPPQESPKTIAAIRSGNVNVTGYDSTQAEAEYKAALAQRVQERDTTMGAVDTTGRMAANALFGAGDRVSAGFDTLTGDGSYSENLARQRFESDAAREANPLAAFVGDTAGLIGGTAGTGRFAQSVATRFMPNLARQGMVGSSFGRNVANDVAYGTAYGATEQGNPLTGGLTAGAGSAGGQFLGKTLGSVIGGVSDPVVQRLAERGIPMTMGGMLGNQGRFGKLVNSFESLPLIGPGLYDRRMAGNEAVFKGVLDDAVAPTGAAIRGSGVDGLAEAQAARSQAYGDAYNGINAQADMPYLNEVAPFIRTGRELPGDFGRDFSYAVESDLRPLFGNNRTLTGDTAQQMRQDLAEYAGDFGKKGKLGSKGADQFRGIGTATDNLIERTNPGALPKIKAANQVNANLTPIENAMNTANGSIPSPLQLRRAITNNTKNYGGRSAAARGDKVPQLLDDAVEVLPPTIPNSGTADRLSSMLVPAALGGSTVGLGALTEPEYAGPLAFMTLLSTKSGQKALQTAMTARTKGMRRAGGIFGSGKVKRLAAASGVGVAPMLLPE